MQNTKPTQQKAPFRGVQIAGFYSKTRKRDGATYFQSARVGNIRYLLLPSDKAGTENERGYAEPDFSLFVVPIIEGEQAE